MCFMYLLSGACSLSSESRLSSLGACCPNASARGFSVDQMKRKTWIGTWSVQGHGLRFVLQRGHGQKGFLGRKRS